MIDFTTTQCLLFPDMFAKHAVLQFDERQGSSYGDPYFPIYCIYLRCKSAYRKGFARPRLSTGQALTCYRGCLLDRRTQEATEEEKR